MIPEFSRCVEAAKPKWFLMENVKDAPGVEPKGYAVERVILNNRWVGGEQHRVRSFVFGKRGAGKVRFKVATHALEPAGWSNTVLASGGVKPGTEHRRGKRPGREYGYHGARALAHAIEAQGLDPDFLSASPFTNEGKFKVVGNGVPLPMGRAIAAAVLEATRT